jgi:hypothetical protein
MFLNLSFNVALPGLSSVLPSMGSMGFHYCISLFCPVFASMPRSAVRTPNYFPEYNIFFWSHNRQCMLLFAVSWLAGLCSGRCWELCF